MKRLERFEDCRSDVIPHIKFVLRNFYNEQEKSFKNDKSLQVISTHRPHNAFTSKFREPVKSIICVFWEELEEVSEKEQCLINAIGEYFDEDGDRGKRLEPFECCHNNVRLYIPRVLDRLFSEKRRLIQANLDNGSLQIISSHIKKGNLYFTVKFEKSVKSIIYINWEKLNKKAEEEKIYSIAHEIGHYFAGEGESRLLEMEANNWLKKWGKFGDIIEIAEHSAPKDEEEGYICGYNWANTQPEDGLQEVFSPYLVLWRKEGLDRRKEEGISQQLETKVRGFLDGEDCDPTYLRGVAFGVMKRVREISDRH